MNRLDTCVNSLGYNVVWERAYCRAIETEEAWRDCVERRGTSAKAEQMSLLRAYFDEGHDYGREAHAAELQKARAETAAIIVARVRANCTPSGDAYSRGGDILIAAVADWIENPPEWVDAPWTSGGAS